MKNNGQGEDKLMKQPLQSTSISSELERNTQGKMSLSQRICLLPNLFFYLGFAALLMYSFYSQIFIKHINFTFNFKDFFTIIISGTLITFLLSSSLMYFIDLIMGDIIISNGKLKIIRTRKNSYYRLTYYDLNTSTFVDLDFYTWFPDKSVEGKNYRVYYTKYAKKLLKKEPLE